MIESLQTARVAHRLLIGICFVGLVFAFSPNREVSLQNALREIDKLEELIEEDDGGIYLFVHKVMEGIDSEVSIHPFFANMEQMANRLELLHHSHTFEAFAIDFEIPRNSFDSELWKVMVRKRLPRTKRV